MQFENSKEYQQIISTKYYGFAALPLLAFTWVYLEMKHRDLMPYLEDTMLNVAATVLGLMLVISVVYPFVMFRKQIPQVRALNSLREKLTVLYKLYLKVYALLFLAMVIAVSGFYLTQIWFFGFGFVIVILLFSYHRPHNYKFCRDLRLPPPEREAIMKEHKIR